MSDEPTVDGATNVFLTQRAAGSPYRRQEVSIKGNANQGKALGFSAGGTLMGISAAQMIAVDQDAAQAALGIALSLVPVTAHGAVTGAPGAATNKAAIEAAAAAAVAAGLCGIYIPAGTWHTSAGIVIPKDCDVIMDGKLLYTGTANEAALSIGNNALNQHNLLRRFQLNVERSTIGDWTSEASIGIRFYSLYQSHIDITQCNGFTIGLEVRAGLSTGSYYNTFRLGKLWNNKFGVRITNSTGGSCNSNKFFGGTFSVNTGVNTASDRIGIHITSDDGFHSNDNTFVGPSIELWASDSTGDCKAVWVECGERNSVWFARDENNDPPFLREAPGCTRNAVETDVTRGIAIGKGSSLSTNYNIQGCDMNQLQVFGVRDDGSQRWGDASLVPGPHVEVENKGGGTAFREFTGNRFCWGAYEHIFYNESLGTERARINAAGSLEVATVGQGFILKSPDGTRYRIQVANGGALSSTPA